MNISQDLPPQMPPQQQQQPQMQPQMPPQQPQQQPQMPPQQQQMQPQQGAVMLYVEPPPPPPPPAFTLQQLTTILSDIKDQPRWRDNAAKAAAYYDGDQLNGEVFRKLMARGQPPAVHNLIAPTIDGALGMEAKTRTELQVVADDPGDDLAGLAQALNAHFADVCRLCGFGKARSEAYADLIKTGFGVVEVTRSDDPFAESEYRIRRVHRDEVYWDWTSKEADWSDARWVMRQRWMDADEAKSRFPQISQILDNTLDDWRGFVNTELVEATDPALFSAWQDWQAWQGRDFEWLIRTGRKRIKLQVVYYRQYKKIVTFQQPDGRISEFNPKNLIHAIALSLGKIQLKSGVTSLVREAWFAGPHLIYDIPCRAPQGLFPLVPFWGYRKDGSGEPYGLISRAIPAQDEVNFRRMKLTHILNVKRVIKDADATNMSDRELRENIARPDGIITLNPDRRNQTTAADALNIQQDVQIAGQQFQVMRDSMQTIQDSMGIYAAMLGQQSNATSGVAISNLVEQGATTLAEINDNYAYACQQLGKLLLEYLLEDMKGRAGITIAAGSKGGSVTLNAPDGQGGLSNDISQLRAHIALAPVQQTPAYKAQMAQQMTSVIQSLPPQVQAAVLDLWVEMLDLPNKAEFLARIRGALNIPKPEAEMSDEEKQQAAAQQQQAQQQQAQMAQFQQAQTELALREQAARVAHIEAQAGKSGAQADGQRFVNALHQAKAGQIIQSLQ